MELLNLRENEKVIINQTCDLWEGFSQKTGVVELTNERLAFRYKALLGAAKDNVIEVEVSDIASTSKCNVGPGPVKIIPTGVKVVMNNGDKFLLSLMGRDKLTDAVGR